MTRSGVVALAARVPLVVSRSVDDPHSFLCVVRAVRQRDQGRRANLADPETVPPAAFPHPTGNPVDEVRADGGD